MSHTIYTTNAIVLNRISTGEADSTVWLLTEDLGILVARAQSARKETAKMRPYLQSLAIAQVSLVRGKHVWRLTGAEASQYTHHEKVNPSALVHGVLAKLSVFIRRMTLTDTQNTQELFQHVLSAWEAMTPENHEKVELATIAQILITLGYLDSIAMSDFESNNISKDTFIHLVNNAIIESHL